MVVDVEHDIVFTDLSRCCAILQGTAGTDNSTRGPCQPTKLTADALCTGKETNNMIHITF